MTRIAILIADSNEPFFQNVKDELYEVAWSKFRENDIDVFYIKGKSINGWAAKTNHYIEGMRYSRFWILQYLIDNLILFKYRFSKPNVLFNRDQIGVDTPEGLKYLTVKILAGLDALREKNYDFVFRTTLSTVLNYDNFIKLISQFRTDEEIYAGYLIDFNQNQFISGSSSLFSRRTIETLVRGRIKLNFGRLDDVAFGRVLSPRIPPISLPHFNLATLEDVKKLSNKDLLKGMSYRCKSSAAPRNDVIIMKTLLQRLSDGSN